MNIKRFDQCGRDVTDSPGLWDESDIQVKPCPACETAWDGGWNHGVEGPQFACGNPRCELRGPCGIDMEDAEKRWNALPRRGDAPAWRRSRPPRTRRRRRRSERYA